MGGSSGPATRRARVVAATLAAAAGVVPAAGTAHADVVLQVNYPLTGTTFIKSTGSSMSLGPGTLAASLDEDFAITAKTTLPPATGSFKEFGVIPVSVTTEFIETTPTTGKVDVDTGAVQTTSHFTLRLTDLKVAGIPTPVGDHCETKTPAVISVASDANFNILTGGNLNGAYTIPPFQNCLLATPLIDLTVPGAGNTITLTLGAATVPSSSPAADPTKVLGRALG